MKNFQNPTDAIKNVACAICVLYNRKETWEEGKKIMSEMDFQKNLLNLDPMSLDNKIWMKLKNDYISRSEFQPESLKNKS